MPIHSLILTTLLTALACLAPGLTVAAQAPTRQTETIVGDLDAEVTRFQAEGGYLALWIAPGYGVEPEHLAFGRGLADAGIEVWMTDLVDAFFLPRDRNAMLQIDPEAVADLVMSAHQRTGKSVVLMGTAGAAIPLLRGARAWQARTGPAGGLIGAVLLSPELYRAVPALGEAPEYLPIVRATRVPLVVIQSGLRTGARRLNELVEALASGGSPVYARLLPEVSVLFVDQARSPRARAIIDALPGSIARTLPLLAATPYETAPAPVTGEMVSDRPGLDAAPKPMPRAARAKPIRLADIRGRDWRIDDFLGRVTVINFWATWCPPCVEEIPSLSRLQAAMDGEDFRLISIDLGETPDVVRDFLQRVHVDFPVLMDNDGAVGGAWQVIALPSTFVVGPDGSIRYGTNGAIHWDDPEIISNLKALGRETGQ